VLSREDLAVHGRRLLSAVILLFLFLLLVIHGGERGFALLAMVAAGISVWEFGRLADPSVPWRVMALLGAAGLVGVTSLRGIEWFGLGALLFLLLELSRVVGSGEDIEANLRRASLCVVGVLYPAGPLSIAVALRGMPEGVPYILLACGVVWIGDTAAFYVGSSLGRRPLAPRISPKKSIEGSVAGLLASMLGSWVGTRALGMPVPFLSSLLLGAVIGVAGQLGDLVESGIKRAFHVKDTGDLIPGHGGILDRIDSLLFALPVFYLWARMGWI
jgi:phosphatidate cytidylyltransferase